MSDLGYKRVLLKISGEQLAGRYGFGIDPAIAKYLAHEVKKIVELGCQVVLVVGGGNMVRGSKAAGNGIKRVTAEQMGMLSGLINCMSLTDIFDANGIDVRCLSSIYAEQLTEAYNFRRAEKYLESGKVVIIAGGLARPYFTHDTAGVNYALELSCELMLKATKVDGVYDKDPEKYADAKKIPNVSYEEALENEAILVMDKTAVALAMEYELPVVILDPENKDSLLKACKGEKVGSLIS